jgi:tRNA A37 threonylcarbamoyladenosine dehydratase
MTASAGGQVSEVPGLAPPSCAADGETPGERRFGGVARLLGDDALARLAASHVVVVGIGGVGSWCAEALARSGIGALTLVDLDHVAESNINRQIHALNSTLGAAKAQTMAARIAQISPACQVHVVDDFITPENAAELLPGDAILVDAIDQPRAKAAMIAVAVSRGQSLVVCGAAGGVADGLGLTRGDLAHTRGDPLLASVRARLRRNHGFTRELKRAFKVDALYFPHQRAARGSMSAEAGSPLACAGYGSIVTVTAAMGLAAAGLAIEMAIRNRR